MRKEKLSGTLEEQCEFLYQLAQEKLADGNYSGAYHALKEILRHVPDYKEAPQLLAHVQQKKSEQRKLLLMGLLGAVLFTGFGTLIQLSNDLIFILLAIVGAVVGFVVGSLLFGQRGSKQQVV
ncbi:MAG: hypothetical protein KDE19_00310 [Caldilineaceae bacterium]|nr:hypothetical protein [Caldilineaceae bacterium]